MSNEFLVTTHADAALTYNDASVNENMHAALAFRLLRKPGNNFLEARAAPCPTLTPPNALHCRVCILSSSTIESSTRMS